MTQLNNAISPSPMDKGQYTNKVVSPLRLMLILIISVFVGEFLIMHYVVADLFSMSWVYRSLIDAGLLTIIVYPCLYFFMFSPIQKSTVLQKQTQDELSISKQMLEDIAQGITESIILLSRDYKILWANKATADLTGLSPQELLGNCCYRVTHHRDTPCEPPEDPCPVHQLLKTGTTQIAEHLHYDQNGNKIYVEVKAYPVKNEAGEIIEIIHITRDITQRKTMEQEREKLILDLREALSKVKTLSGMLPICANCKKIRDDRGYWNQIESYIRRHSSAEFTHGLCPECTKKIMEE